MPILTYFAKRLLYMVMLLWIVSIATFIIIELPPGDYLTYLMSSSGQNTNLNTVNPEHMEALKKQYGLDLPLPLRYFRWAGNMLRGNFGQSFQNNRPVREILAERLPLTILISLCTLVFVYAMGIPIGIYSALKQYSIGDYLFTFIGFIGLALPGFMVALIVAFIVYNTTGINPTGLFSPQYAIAPWSAGKVWDLLKHLPVPVIVIGISGTAGIIRVMRGCLLEELKKQYVTTARARGLSEFKVIVKYAVRGAISPIVSSVGWLLPAIVSGETITAIVLNLPTTGSMLLQALLSQDTYLAGSTVMFLSLLTLVGMFVSDLLLLWLDPRIRFEKVR